MDFSDYVNKRVQVTLYTGNKIYRGFCIAVDKGRITILTKDGLKISLKENAVDIIKEVLY